MGWLRRKIWASLIQLSVLMPEELSLWQDSPTRQAILDFVVAISDENSPDYRPPAERIATFDNDGTLWCEKPTWLSMQTPSMATGGDCRAAIRAEEFGI